MALAPFCGGWGSVPDGVYDIVDDTLQAVGALGAAGRSRDELQALIDLFTGARDRGASAEEISAEIAEHAPDAAPMFSRLLEQAEKRAGLAAWISIIVSILLYIASCANDDEVNVVIQQPDAVIERICEDIHAAPAVTPPSQPRAKAPRRFKGMATSPGDVTRIVRIGLLAEPSGSIIENASFEDVIIRGPAVLGLLGGLVSPILPSTLPVARPIVCSSRLRRGVQWLGS